MGGFQMCLLGWQLHWAVFSRSSLCYGQSAPPPPFFLEKPTMGTWQTVQKVVKVTVTTRRRLTGGWMAASLRRGQQSVFRWKQKWWLCSFISTLAPGRDPSRYQLMKSLRLKRNDTSAHQNYFHLEKKILFHQLADFQLKGLNPAIQWSTI